ncbi:MAG: glycosyltransferase [Candidatus Staskawiczbacteria bacterium]|nr:glycosyltransferase [Candidatus Staskawiczbacteria bacterium]
MEPLVSIIIPTYNGAKYIKRAIDSIFKQTYKNSEIIIVDDGSTDETPKIIEELKKGDSRIVIAKHETNKGFVKSLNKGLQEAKGSYIARLDDDDFWIDDKKLEKQVGFLEKNPEYVLVGGGLIKIDANGKEIIRYLFPEQDDQIRKSILISNSFAHSGVVFRKAAVSQVGGYDERFGFFADRELWLKIGTVGKFYNFPEYFTSYLDKEVNNYNYNGRNVQIRRKLISNLALRKKYKNDYPGYWQSFFLCIASYLYSFLPFRLHLWPLVFRLRVIIFGQPAYKYFENKNV